MRRFLLAALLSYKALFTWLNPWGYLSSRIIAPISVAILFGIVAVRGGADATRPVVVACYLAVANATIFGITLAIANERQFGTLGLWVIAPQKLFSSLAAKSLCHAVDGMLGAILTFVAGAIVFDVYVPSGGVSTLFLGGVLVAWSGVGIGLCAGAVAMRTRDTFAPANVCSLLILVASGCVVSPALLPVDLNAPASVLPVNHAAQAGLRALSGTGGTGPHLLFEFVVGAVWIAVGMTAMRRLTERGRRLASLDWE